METDKCNSAQHTSVCSLKLKEVYVWSLLLKSWQVVVFVHGFYSNEKDQQIASHSGSKTHSFFITIVVPFLRYYKGVAEI